MKRLINLPRWVPGMLLVSGGVLNLIFAYLDSWNAFNTFLAGVCLGGALFSYLCGQILDDWQRSNEQWSRLTTEILDGKIEQEFKTFLTAHDARPQIH